MKKRCHYLAIFLLLICSSFSAFAELRLGDKFAHAQLGRGLEYIEDPDGSLSYSDIVKRETWEVSGKSTLSFGFTSSTYWVHIGISNQENIRRSLLLHINYPFLDEVELYIDKKSGSEIITTGDSVKSIHRPLNHAQFLIPFEMSAYEDAELYLRVKTVGTVQIPLDLWTEKAFIEDDHRESLIYGLFYGLLLAISVYHFLLFLSVRELSYFYYSMFYVSLLGVYLSLNGIPDVFFWPESTHVTDTFLSVCFGMSIFFPSVFAYEVLAMKNSRPQLGLVMKVVGFIGLALSFLAFFLPYILVIKVVIVVAIISIITNLCVYVYRFLDGYPPAKYMFLSGLFASIGLLVTIFVKLGLIESTVISENAAYAGVVMMALLHAFALSHRINMDRDQLEITQQALLRSQRALNDDLDHMVKARTHELEQVNEKLKLLSTTDALTKVGNRRHFDELYRQSFRQNYRDQTPISLLLLDIDHFKSINDTYGHQFGDTCLIQAAKNILDCVRRPQDSVARFGGEEFVVLLSNTPLDGAVCIAELINEKFRKTPLFSAGTDLVMTISIGVVSAIPSDNLTEDYLLNSADKLLYRAKENGRDRVEWEVTVPTTPHPLESV